MLEAVMLWNEPNNKSHWDFEIDPEWRRFSEMVVLAAKAIREAHPTIPRVLGGISPIDPLFIERMERQGVLEHVDAIGVHGFPLDWNHWQVREWPRKLEEIRAVTGLPVWVSEVGVSSFGAEEVQAWGLRRSCELLRGLSPRVHWYSLFDLPKAWPATTRHREAEGSSYYRHFYMGLIREDGTPKPALEEFPAFTPDVGLCQWFHFRDHRLASAVEWMRRLGVGYLRTGLSWADSFREGADDWFDTQMRALEEFRVTATFCFTPEHRGLAPHHTSPPADPAEFAAFCRRMVARYAPAHEAAQPASADPVCPAPGGVNGGAAHPAVRRGRATTGIGGSVARDRN
jgi:beta-xylosidase